MICKICGNNVADGEKTCDFCGSPIKADALNNDNTVEIVKQQTDSMDMFNIEDTLKVEKITHEEKRENSIAEKNISQNEDMDMFPEVHTISETKTASSKAGKTRNGNNNVAIYVMLGTIVALVCFIVVILIGTKFFNSENETNLSEPSHYEIQESYIESDDKTNITEIDNDKIRNIINQYSDYTDFGIYVHNLNNDYEYGFNDDSVFLASAMCQVVILDTLSRTVDDNNIDINHEELYFSYIPNGKEAPTSKNESDTYISLKKCIEDVAVYGDNNKSNHIVDYIGQVNNVNNGFDVINNMLRRNGYTDTHINRKTFVNPDYIDNSVPANTTTPSEIADIFENLINNGRFENKNYMMNIFKSVALDGQPIGLKKCVPAYYDICNVNALNSQSTNNVAIISDGNTELAIAILSTTDESKTDVENNEDREIVIAELMKYILDTQFEN